MNLIVHILDPSVDGFLNYWMEYLEVFVVGFALFCFVDKNKWQLEKLPESVSLSCVCLVGQGEAVGAECGQGCAQVCSVSSCL